MCKQAIGFAVNLVSQFRDCARGKSLSSLFSRRPPNFFATESQRTQSWEFSFSVRSVPLRLISFFVAGKSLVVAVNLFYQVAGARFPKNPAPADLASAGGRVGAN
jgi:hypothetical protein